MGRSSLNNRFLMREFVMKEKMRLQTHVTTAASGCPAGRNPAAPAQL
jgi:hypothetical protein